MGLAQPLMVDPELVEGWAGGPRPITFAVEPLARMRSPIMAAPKRDQPVWEDERPFTALPPLRELMGPSAVGVLVAAPLLVLAGWQVALVAGFVATIVREVERRMPASYSLAAGFLPYRSDEGWPQGVQEDDDVHWNWSSGNPGQVTSSQGSR